MYQRRPFVMTMVLAILVMGLIWGCASDNDDSTAPPSGPCSLMVHDPEGGETYYSSTVEYILWYSENAGDQVKIELMLADTTHFVIEEATPNDGSTAWTVTTNGAPSDAGFSIKLSNVDDLNCFNQTENFVIIKTEDCEITVLIPQDEDSWTVGDTELIEWVSEGGGGTVNIDLYKLVEGSPTPIYSIAQSVADTGSYNWEVFACHIGGNAVDYQIRVQDATNLNCFSFSDFFTILDPNPCMIAVSTPLEGEVLETDDIYTIEWHGGNQSGNVDIYLKRPGMSDALIGLQVPNSDHQYEWTVSLLGGNPGEGFSIYIEDSDDPCCNGVSAEFEITL